MEAAAPASAFSASAPADDLLGWSRSEVAAWLAASGEKTVHAESIWAGLHRRRAPDLDAMAAVPPRVRGRLREARLRVGTPAVAREVASNDGFTRKFLLRLHDGETIETVLMRFDGRATACLSTQAGCAMGCVFCATGQGGFRRQLGAGEIVAQALHVARVLADEGQRLRNVVLMGQGEPLHNFDAVVRAIDILTDEKGLSLAAKRVTLSTVGLAPGIRRLAAERRTCSLAISLHGASDEERAALVPVARRWPLAELLDACHEYAHATGGRLFFEWTLIDGRNDGAAHAAALAQLLAGLPAHVNLIPLNPTAAFTGAPAAAGRAREFQAVLREHGIPSTIRQRRGLDIAAGCGQLAGAG